MSKEYPVPQFTPAHLNALTTLHERLHGGGEPPSVDGATVALLRSALSQGHGSQPWLTAGRVGFHVLALLAKQGDRVNATLLFNALLDAAK